MIKFYDKIPDMECLQGDTLQEFKIFIENASDFSGMVLILESIENPGKTAQAKACTAADGGFTAQLTSEDTGKLSGVYRMYFCLTGTNGLQYRKIAGILNVRPVAEGS